MSTLFISEFSDLPIMNNGVMQAADAAQWVVDQTVAIGAATSSNAFNAATKYIVITGDAGCSIAWVSIGGSQVATTGNLYIPPNVPMAFGVRGGMKVSVIANT